MRGKITILCASDITLHGFHLPFTFMQIYIAPSKALVQEKLRDWNQKFGSWGVSCLELTGDNETYNMKHIQEADIILTTPEVRTLNAEPLFHVSMLIQS